MEVVLLAGMLVVVIVINVFFVDDLIEGNYIGPDFFLLNPEKNVTLTISY